MAKKIKLEVTEAQLKAIMDMADDAKSMLGTAEDDSFWKKNVMLIYRMLKNNGYKMDYN